MSCLVEGWHIVPGGFWDGDVCSRTYAAMMMVRLSWSASIHLLF